MNRFDIFPRVRRLGQFLTHGDVRRRVSIVFVNKKSRVSESTNFIRSIITEEKWKTNFEIRHQNEKRTNRRIISGIFWFPNRVFSSDTGWTTWTWTSVNNKENWLFSLSRFDEQIQFITLQTTSTMMFLDDHGWIEKNTIWKNYLKFFTNIR